MFPIPNEKDYLFTYPFSIVAFTCQIRVCLTQK